MSVDLMEITAGSKGGPADLSAISDFTLRPAGQILEAVLFRSPDWTLYCLDLPSEQALFVELPPGTDLSGAAFAYSHQFTAARRAALMPFGRTRLTARNRPWAARPQGFEDAADASTSPGSWLRPTMPS